MESIKAFTIFTILVSLVLLVLFKKLTIVECIVFLIPFKTISFDFGIAFSAAHIFVFLWIVQKALRANSQIYLQKPALYFLGYGVLITLFFSLLIVDPVLVGDGGFFRNEGRFITQIILKAILQFGVFFIVINSIKNEIQLKSIFKVLISSWIVIALLGLIQFIIYFITYIDIFPIGHVNIGFLRSGGEINILGIRWFRICSLGGEPKGLSSTLVVASALLHSFNTNGVYFSKYDKFILYLFVTTCLMTLSTGGIVMLLFVPIIPLLLKLVHFRIRFIVPNFKSFILMLVLFFGLIKAMPIVIEVYNNRVIERIGRQGAVEDMDLTVSNFLKANPNWLVLGSGWGNIHSVTQDYIPQRYKYYMENSIYIAKSGYLYLVSETGVLGCILFLYFIYSIVGKVYSRDKRKKINFSLYLTGILIVFFYLLRANYVIYEMLILLALMQCINRENINTDKIFDTPLF